MRRFMASMLVVTGALSTPALAQERGPAWMLGLSATVGSGWQMENADIGFSRLIGLGPLRHIMFTGRFGAFQDEGGLFFGARGFIAGLAVGLATKPWQVLTIGAENNPIGVGLDLTFEGAGYFAKDTPEGFPPGNGFGSVAILPGVRSIKTGDFAFSLMVGPKVLLGGPEPDVRPFLAFHIEVPMGGPPRAP